MDRGSKDFLASVLVFYAYLVQKFILDAGDALAPILIGSDGRLFRHARVLPRTGDECPLASGTCHTTFFSGPNSLGTSLASAAMPSPPGPRNCGQSAADAKTA